VSAPIIIVSGPCGVGKSTVSRIVATEFEMSVHVETDALMAFIVNGSEQPSLPEAEHQNEVVGSVIAVTAMRFAAGGYTTVVDGYLFPAGVLGLARACAERDLPLHYVVLRADPVTCLARATSRGQGRWPLEPVAVADVHAKFAHLDIGEAHVVDASRTPDAVAASVLAAFRAGTVAMTGHA
jgi:predicted kinase